jgi:hypothetical protein
MLCRSCIRSEVYTKILVVNLIVTITTPKSKINLSCISIGHSSMNSVVGHIKIEVIGCRRVGSGKKGVREGQPVRITARSSCEFNFESNCGPQVGVVGDVVVYGRRFLGYAYAEFADVRGRGSGACAFLCN